MKVFRVFKNAVNQAGLRSDIRIHDLRHTFASRLAENGKSLLEIKTLLLHESINSTMIYADLVDEQVNYRDLKIDLV